MWVRLFVRAMWAESNEAFQFFQNFPSLRSDLTNALMWMTFTRRHATTEEILRTQEVRTEKDKAKIQIINQIL